MKNALLILAIAFFLSICLLGFLIVTGFGQKPCAEYNPVNFPARCNTYYGIPA